MRRVVIGAASLVAALTLVTASASAQFYVAGYATLPSGDYGDFAKTGWMAEGGVKLLSSSNKRLGVYVSGGYGQNNGEDQIAFDVKYTSIIGLGQVTYNLTTEGSTMPYLIGSAGYWSLKEDVTDIANETNGGFAWGGGAGIGFASKFFVEGRYLTAKINGATTSQLLLGAGVLF